MIKTLLLCMLFLAVWALGGEANAQRCYQRNLPSARSYSQLGFCENRQQSVSCRQLIRTPNTACGGIRRVTSVPYLQPTYLGVLAPTRIPVASVVRNQRSACRRYYVEPTCNYPIYGSGWTDGPCYSECQPDGDSQSADNCIYAQDF